MTPALLDSATRTARLKLAPAARFERAFLREQRSALTEMARREYAGPALRSSANRQVVLVMMVEYSIDQAINAGYPWLEIKCSRCKTPRAVDLGCPAPRSDHQGARSRRPPALREVQRDWQAAGRGAAATVAALPDRRRDVTKLTRRRDKEAAREKWSILYRDVVVGSIGLRKGVPNHADQWEWKCGFYPGSDRSTGGPAATFDDRRAGFEAAWGALLPTLTEADFQAWRDHRDWIARKQAMWDRGEKLPSQQPSSLMRCPCGATFDSHRPAESQIHTPHHLRCAKARRNSTMNEGRPSLGGPGGSRAPDHGTCPRL
ncbi:hypothetical protein AB7M49_000864 [Bradyrhizobium elkanii]|nr:hypothetical protein [Bradyrhizobium elkanii]